MPALKLSLRSISIALELALAYLNGPLTTEFSMPAPTGYDSVGASATGIGGHVVLGEDRQRQQAQHAGVAGAEADRARQAVGSNHRSP